MSHIIDRRLNPRGKNLGNRQRFLKRAKEQIRESVEKSIQDKEIKSITKGENVNVPIRDISEPTFSHTHKGGNRDIIHPGNHDFVEHDKIKKPPNGSGGKDKKAGQGEGEDDFAFTLTREEFLDFFFEGLELPDMVKQKLKDTKVEKPKRAGYSPVGNPCNLDVKLTTKFALARRIALKRPSGEEVEALEQEIEEAKREGWPYVELEVRLEELQRRNKSIPWIDPVDVRYKQFVIEPQPIAQAVMFCIMDVSGSMGEREKDLAKRFFMLLYLFLEKKYEKVDIVFIRHTDRAEEVSEHDFFYDKFSGGTTVSTGLKKTLEVIKDRYAVEDWNIYCAQISDGENFGGDSLTCENLLNNDLLSKVQYMAYIEIIEERENQTGFHLSRNGDLWNHYAAVSQKWKNFSMSKIREKKDIFPVFRDLFKKEK